MPLWSKSIGGQGIVAFSFDDARRMGLTRRGRLWFGWLVGREGLGGVYFFFSAVVSRFSANRQQIANRMLDKCVKYAYNNYRKEGPAMAQISVRVDDDVKKNAEQVCAEIGISMAAAINVYLKKLGREHRIPFEMTADPFYSSENMQRLRASIAQMERTGGTIHEVHYDD